MKKIANQTDLKEKPINQKAYNKLKMFLGITIPIFAFVLYAQSISFDYTHDDDTVISGNKITKEGFAAIPTILRTDYWYGFIDEIRIPQYRPAPLILLAIEWQFFPGNPHIYHFINVLLYALTCWLLYLLLCKLFEKQNLVFPFICALLYTAHPIHTEVVDSIKSIDEILCFLFGLLSIFLITQFVEKKSVIKLILASVCYLICLMSKETGITFLILIPLILFTFTKAGFKKMMNISFLLIIITSCFLFIRFKVLESVSSTAFNFPLAQSLFNAPDSITQKATSFYILLRYILLLMYPNPLVYDYSFAQIPFQTFSDITTITAIVIYLALGIYSLIYIRKKSILAFAILFYLITLIPISNIFLLVAVPMAERFMYIPSLGFCIAFTFILIKITKTGNVKNTFISRKKFITSNAIVFIIISILTAAYSVKIFSRNPVWKDNVELYGNDTEIANNSARAHFSWGLIVLQNLYPKEQNEIIKRNLLDKALNEFIKAKSIYNSYPNAYYYIGLCYFNKKDYPNAIVNYEIAKQQYLKPNVSLLTNLALCYGLTDYPDSALANVDSAIKYEPNNELAHINRGFILNKLGRFSDAIIEYQKCIALDSQLVMAYKNIGDCYVHLKQFSNAIEYFNKALAFDKNDLYSLKNLGQTYGTLKQFPKALKYFNRVIEIDSTDIDCLRFIGITYQNLGDKANASRYLEKANKMRK